MFLKKFENLLECLIVSHQHFLRNHLENLQRLGENSLTMAQPIAIAEFFGLLKGYRKNENGNSEFLIMFYSFPVAAD